MRVGSVVTFILGTAWLWLPSALAGPGAIPHGHHAPKGEMAYGRPGDPSKSSRVVPITMTEQRESMLFIPDRVEFAQGEQVLFRLVNQGKTSHEFVIATVEENRKHVEEMKKNPDMEHDDPNAKHLHPNESGEILWQFTKAGEFDFSCLIPGHREAGMTGKIIVK